MYLDYFGLKERPFSIAPDPRYLYMSERHREALAHLLFGVSGQGGFILLTGEVGTGKTTICRCFLEQVPENTDVAFIVNPKLSARELMASICDELDIEHQESASIKKLNDLINEYLLSAHAVCRHTVLIIDEAQNLSVDVLEQLRLLTNLETTEKKLLQIVLLGQPELRDILEQTELRQLSQRITARYHLNELNKLETHAYVKARLSIAGCKGVLFSKAALNRLFKKSHGVPRLINLIADRAMLGAYATHSEIVEPEHVNQACKEVLGDQLRFHLPKKLYYRTMAFTVMAFLVFVGAVLVSEKRDYIESRFSSFIESDFITGLGDLFVQADDEVTLQDEDVISVDNEAMLSGNGANQKADNELERQRSIAESDHSILSVSNSDMDDHVEKSESLPMFEEVPNDPFSHAKSSRLGRYMAFKAVFGRWGKNYPKEPLSLACRFAESKGLQCLHKQGNWRSLININRPAVLELVNRNGEQFYIALLSIDNDVADVSYLDKGLQVPISLIDQYWLGQYSVIWKLPPYKSNLITPDSNVSENQWLSEKLSLANLHTDTDEELIEPLKTRLKRFQSSSGLEPDGIAGSRTLIELNSRFDSSVPKLSPHFFSAASSTHKSQK